LIGAPPLPALSSPTGDGEVALREWRLADSDQVAAACSDEQIQLWIPVPSPYTLEDAREYISTRERERLEGRELGLAITPAIDDAKLLGSIAIVRPSLRDRRVELGYWVAPEARGRGVATRAVRLLGDWALRSLPIDRLEIIVAVENVASCAVARAAGYEQEALLRSYLVDRAGVHDAAVFARLR
jgi:RimJ/RimL family protein N-acetyltransferase